MQFISSGKSVRTSLGTTREEEGLALICSNSDRCQASRSGGLGARLAKDAHHAFRRQLNLAARVKVFDALSGRESSRRRRADEVWQARTGLKKNLTESLSFLLLSESFMKSPKKT